MLTIDSFILYVENIELSKKFYTEIFERDAQILSPTFISFCLSKSCTLELKQLAQVSPITDTTGGGTELSIQVPDTKSLNELFVRWKNIGIKFLQPPTELIFGLTFVAVDPDKHRIRVFTQNT